MVNAIFILVIFNFISIFNFRTLLPTLLSTLHPKIYVEYNVLKYKTPGLTFASDQD